MTTGRLLILAPRVTDTRLQLAAAAHRRGLRAVTAHGWRRPEEAGPGTPAHLYGGPLLADSVGGALGLVLLEPPADWLARLPQELTCRRVEAVTLAEARRLRRPAFVKPPVDKHFPARIHTDGSRLPGPDALDDDLPVLVSDIVRFVREYRLLVLDGAVRTASRYAVGPALDTAPLEEDPHHADVLAFARDLLTAAGGSLPSAAVVDVGLLDDGRWAVVEANPAWASGGYACDPDRVLDVVLRAAGPAAEAGPCDLPFARRLPEAVG
ncbi:ATP-grasp domain-containing protein [Streptacidiphilus sp. ASG 303]|uniref:ATP-grasp domain-containing protein n=1 Tax=Streptomycetaceae TaxID=2062 RepID=UPI001E44BBC7|nr:ATP-grasp domain-containing protein [Streptacidiphilus sp. ASG 303]MCD0484344.1 ATP-grasp domain-containing protein [Streptacidiphilus sp. ASG 303]